MRVSFVRAWNEPFDTCCSPGFAQLSLASTHHRFPTPSVDAGEGSEVVSRRALTISHPVTGRVTIGMNDEEVSNRCVSRT